MGFKIGRRQLVWDLAFAYCQGIIISTKEWRLGKIKYLHWRSRPKPEGYQAIPLTLNSSHSTPDVHANKSKEGLSPRQYVQINQEKSFKNNKTHEQKFANRTLGFSFSANKAFGQTLLFVVSISLSLSLSFQYLYKWLSFLESPTSPKLIK